MCTVLKFRGKWGAMTRDWAHFWFTSVAIKWRRTRSLTETFTWHCLPWLDMMANFQQPLEACSCKDSRLCEMADFPLASRTSESSHKNNSTMWKNKDGTCPEQTVNKNTTCRLLRAPQCLQMPSLRRHVSLINVQHAALIDINKMSHLWCLLAF